MNNSPEAARQSTNPMDQRFALNGEHGSLRAWLDGSHHLETREPTFCVDVIYLDRVSQKRERTRQRGLRAFTVANIGASVCLGEENLTTEVVDKITERFQL